MAPAEQGLGEQSIGAERPVRLKAWGSLWPGRSRGWGCGLSGPVGLEAFPLGDRGPGSSGPTGVGQGAPGEGQQQPDPAGGKKGADFRDIPPPPAQDVSADVGTGGRAVLRAGVGRLAGPWTESRDVDLAVF